MSKEKIILPVFLTLGFHCPLCGFYANQVWIDPLQIPDGNPLNGMFSIKNLTISQCDYCHDFSVWIKGKIVYPLTVLVEQPNEDLTDEIKSDYLEAANILHQSPRGAAALLRLAIQRLMLQLGEGGKDINKDIGELVKKGLQKEVQQALDTVRVIGNEAVHPGELDLKDDVVTVNKLFVLINIIADRLISQPNKINDMFGSLPSAKLIGIENRDK